MFADIADRKTLEERYKIIFIYEDRFGGRYYIAQAYRSVALFYGSDAKLKFVNEFNYIGFAIFTILKAEEAYYDFLRTKHGVKEVQARLAHATFNEICEKLNLSIEETMTSPNYNDLVNGSSFLMHELDCVDCKQEVLDNLLDKLVFHLGFVMDEVTVVATDGKKSVHETINLQDWYADYLGRKKCPRCRSANVVYELTTFQRYLKCKNCEYEANAHSVINEGHVENCRIDIANYRVAAFELQEMIRDYNGEPFTKER